MTLKVLSVIGTRPEAIKMAPVVLKLKAYSDQIKSCVCVTAQHREMLDQVLEIFAIVPDYDLDVMSSNQTPIKVMSIIFDRLEAVLAEEQPDWVLVQGDTTTVLAASLVAFHHRIRLGHVEAGLRTWNKYHPFPEEINRRVADLLADRHFAPTERARGNLLAEGIADEQILMTGNTVIDAMLLVANKPHNWHEGPLAALPQDKRLILVTAHRRENFGAPLEHICLALRDIAQQYVDDVHIVYPVHRNPRVRNTVFSLLGDHPNITLLDPLEYGQMVQLLKRSTLVLTDSGGLQEEAPSLQVPVLVLRETTERPEAVEAGAARLVGTNRQAILAEAKRLLDDPSEYAKMSQVTNPYGDGQAATRIVESLLKNP